MAGKLNKEYVDTLRQLQAAKEQIAEPTAENLHLLSKLQGGDCMGDYVLFELPQDHAI